MNVEVPASIVSMLRDCQNESINTISNYLDEPSEGACLISLPTGSGKSGVICCVAHYSKIDKILIVSHRRAVCNQLYRQLRGGFFEKILQDKYEPSLVKKDVINGISLDVINGIYCTTFQKLTSLQEEDLNRLKSSFQLILIDEGHAEPSPQWGSVIRKFESKKVIITATPYRNDLFSFDIDVNHAFIYTYKKAINDKVIVKPTFEEITSEQLTHKILNFREKNPDAVCIVKCRNFDDICRYYSFLKDTFKTLAIHDRFKDEPLDDNLHYVPAKIDELDYEVYIHQRKLDEGIDLPQAKILILTYSVGSGKELVQTIGRVVRVFRDYNPIVFELGNSKNIRLWDNYIEFDSYISEKSSAEKFLNTLNTASLLESYLDAFPEHSYFESSYKKKFNFSEFEPARSLVIPSASVCFINKLPNFDLADFIDKIYWEFTREGALSKYDKETGVITSVCFNNSKFLIDRLFFEPSLEIVIVKDLGTLVAIFDSSGRRFNHRTDLNLGRAVNSDTLYKVFAQTEKSRTTQATSRAILGSSSKAEGIAYIGENLESTNHPQSNSSYAVTTAKGSNLNIDDKIASSYYLGIGSGRISDQKFRNFDYDGFCAWIDDIKYTFDSNNKLNSDFLNSFSQPIDEAPDEEPISCVIDFSSISGVLELEHSNCRVVIQNTFLFKMYNRGISFFKLQDINLRIIKKIPSPFTFRLSDYRQYIASSLNNKISFNFKNDEFEVKTNGVSVYLNGAIVSSENIFNANTVKLLFNKGVTFLNGIFYKFQLPSENGGISQAVLDRIYPLKCLSNPSLSEKDLPHLTPTAFGVNSIFSLIDNLSNVRNYNPTISELGDFYEHIPDVDMILCTDMDTEPADFVISSKSKLIYVHVKCGKTTNPESSAGAITEVGSQALKNIHFLISQNSALEYANLSRLKKCWPSDNGNDNRVKLNSRIRLYNKKFDDNHSLEDVLDLIKQRRSMISIRKEIWIVIGNAFSKKHFERQFSGVGKISPESLQAYQLIDTWLLQASSYDIDVKFFVSD
ncbi:DEAD/DEAH box helicase [Enterobacter sp. CP102]|uniref:DEAD/DEAH box helicase n=1 Tax=Enterobacter sp. CP102 TaxID=2976431 RepID=UPI002203627D|nr:DEAD/DEAH box helicase family protein [Enterobacter sp. CP102]UWM65751.1 DEAD/DEAH box helicase family protein [Enterobacter sp. CP102]